MNDTSPEMEARYHVMLLARSPEERLRMAGSMYSAARRLVVASILAADPSASPAAVRRALFLRFYGHEFDGQTQEKIMTRLGSDETERPGSSRQIPLASSIGRLRLATEWMGARGWREILGKSAAYRQSLFHHVLTELGFIEAVEDLIRGPDTLALSDDQVDVLFTAVLCHDAGKADPSWQAAVNRGARPPGHVHHKEVERAIDDWLAYVGSDRGPGFVAAVRAAIGLHHRATQGPASVLDHLLHGDQHDPRWRELARLVEGIDKTCSASTVNEAASAARMHFDARLDFAFHRVQVLRGVSTVFLHQACETTFTAGGWARVVHYLDGTLYAAPAARHRTEPTIDVIRLELASLLGKLLDPEKLAEQVVGNPTTDILPKPEFFELDRLEAYLRVASRRSKGENLRRQLWKEQEQQFTPEFEQKFRAYWQHKGKAVPVGVGERKRILDRLVGAVPLDGVFRFFKAALVGDKLFKADHWPLEDPVYRAAEAAGALADGDEARKEQVRDKYLAAARRRGLDSWRNEHLQREYESVFGPDTTFAELKGVGNDPAKNLARVIDSFLEKLDDAGVKWSSKPPDVQIDELIRQLVGIVKRSNLPPATLPPALKAEDLAEVFLMDLVVPGLDRRLDAEEHLRSYSCAKDLLSGGAICPFSNEPSAGVPGSGSDLGLKTDGHSNRLPVHGKTWKERGGVATSRSMRYELMLRRLILGRPAAKVLVLIPPLSLGAAEGRRLVDEVAQLEQDILLHSGELTPDPAKRFSFGLTDQMARNRRESREARLVDILAFRRAGEKAGADRAKLKRGLLEAFDLDATASDATGSGAAAALRSEAVALESLNRDCGASFATWDEALEELYLGQSERARRALEMSEELRARRRQALDLTREAPGRFICQTPNLILALLPDPIRVGKDSEANAAIRELFLSLVIADVLGVGVAVVNPDDMLTFTGGEGVVRIPQNAALRSEIARVRARLSATRENDGVSASHEWLLPHEVGPWSGALEAIHQVAAVRDAERQAIFPPNAALYDVLSARSAGALLRRVEAKAKARASIGLIDALDALAPFLG